MNKPKNKSLFDLVVDKVKNPALGAVDQQVAQERQANPDTSPSLFKSLQSKVKQLPVNTPKEKTK